MEQKNHTLVRAFFGEARFDTNRHQRLLDLLYDKMWLYYNFFQPVLHLVEKQLSAQEGQITYRRKWDQAQ
ncbi:MAG: integrase, partial [Chloroflexi bacterium]|nr:integrase [Chloroflexota bacterium]